MTVLALPIRNLVDPTNLVMLYLLAIVITALRLGRGPSMLASALSVIAFDLFFIPPHLTFVVSDAQYILTFIGLFVVGAVISALTARAREQAHAAQRREAQVSAAYELSRALAAALSLEEIGEVVVQHVAPLVAGEVAILLPHRGDGGDILTRLTATPDYHSDAGEDAVALWSYRHGRSAGHDTDTLPAASGHFLPLKTLNEVVGVLGILRAERAGPLLSEQRRLLESFASQAALAIQRAQLAVKTREIELLQTRESLQSALLNSISHDLRTPLASITGALSSLRENSSLLDRITQQELLETAWEEANRLNRLVGNLLDMSRLEAGSIRLHQEPCDVEDLIGSALAQMADRLRQRPLELNTPDDLPMVTADFVLIVQVLVNLLDNAVKYSEANTPITVGAVRQGDVVEIFVADRGIGLPAMEQERIFDKFYRVPRPDGNGGTGLGLSIAKGIVQAHSGPRLGCPRGGGGTVITFTLPLASAS